MSHPNVVFAKTAPFVKPSQLTVNDTIFHTKRLKYRKTRKIDEADEGISTSCQC
jgi:hypothetical protein